MVFSSNVFIFCFLPIVILFDRFLKDTRLSNIWLLLASLIFFSWSQPKYLWLIIASIVINYLSGILVEKNQTIFGSNRIAFILCILLNVGLLFYFKYFDFNISSINMIFGKNIPLKNVILPIGISFFTFQGMSYVIDVYKGEVKATYKITDVALYIALFPQLIAGPIVRYTDIYHNIHHREKDYHCLYEGIRRFIVGLGKKAIIANSLGAVVDQIWKQGAGNNTVGVAWIGSIFYALQIYYDFSGYSDMAIGIGHILGFHFPENFDRPYLSTSISEFWRRWHMTLSGWFRDYIYISMGGNRKHEYLNLLIVFIITGIWHGASWNFVVWGGYNAFFILMERLIRNRRNETDESSSIKGSGSVIKHIYTLLVVNIGWVIFRSESLSSTVLYLKNMVGINVGLPRFSVMWYLDSWNLTILIVAIIFCSDLPRLIGTKLNSDFGMTITTAGVNLSLAAVYFMSILRIVSGTYNPFIYFQF